MRPRIRQKAYGGALALIAAGAVLLAVGLLLYYPAGTSGAALALIAVGAGLAAVGLLLLVVFALVRFVKAAARD